MNFLIHCLVLFWRNPKGSYSIWWEFWNMDVKQQTENIFSHIFSEATINETILLCKRCRINSRKSNLEQKLESSIWTFFLLKCFMWSMNERFWEVTIWYMYWVEVNSKEFSNWTIFQKEKNIEIFDAKKKTVDISHDLKFSKLNKKQSKSSLYAVKTTQFFDKLIKKYA